MAVPLRLAALIGLCAGMARLHPLDALRRE